MRFGRLRCVAVASNRCCCHNGAEGNRSANNLRNWQVGQTATAGGIKELESESILVSLAKRMVDCRSAGLFSQGRRQGCLSLATLATALVEKNRV
jgi:hypothetical protein